MDEKMQTVKTTGALPVLIKRNVKLFFKDKGTFLTALITPMILLILYVLFLYDVYESSFMQAFPPELGISEETLKPIMKGLVGGILVSSLLAVSTVTVSCCANLFIVQDRASGVRRDMDTTPTKSNTLAVGYFVSTVINGMLISTIATLLGFIYLACTGWYLSAGDILKLFLDVLLLVSFGTALSSLLFFSLKTQGQASAVGTMISSTYGFLCGAYMPISQYGVAFRNVLAFFPGVYGTSLMRNHALAGVYREMVEKGLPEAVIGGVRDMSDCNLYFFGDPVKELYMYLALIGATLVLTGIYILLHSLASKKR